MGVCLDEARVLLISRRPPDVIVHRYGLIGHLRLRCLIAVVHQDVLEQAVVDAGHYFGAAAGCFQTVVAKPVGQFEYSQTGIVSLFEE